MNAGGVEERVAFEGKTAGVEELVTNFYEEEEQQKLQRVDDVVCDLRGDQVEAKHAGYKERGERGGSEQWVDANDKARGERPG